MALAQSNYLVSMSHISFSFKFDKSISTWSTSYCKEIIKVRDKCLYVTKRETQTILKEISIAILKIQFSTQLSSHLLEVTCGCKESHIGEVIESRPTNTYAPKTTDVSFWIKLVYDLFQLLTTGIPVLRNSAIRARGCRTLMVETSFFLSLLRQEC